MTERSLHERIDEVILGLASEADVAEIEALCAADSDVAAQYARAQNRFLALDDTADILALPTDLWARIETALAPAAADTDAVDTDADRASAKILAFAPRSNTLNRWKAAALSGAIAATVMAVALGWSLMRIAVPTVVAVLLDDQGQAIAVIEGTEKNQTLITLLAQTSVPDDRVMQVWTKPDDNGPPVSLGLLAAARSRTLTAEGLPPPRADQLYEITFEPTGGSPTNLPTGPILGKGLAKTPVL
jgi:anti-sigma-K factor RskA